MLPIKSEQGSSKPRWIPFSGMRTKVSSGEKDRYSTNRNVFNLRNLFETLSDNRKRKDRVTEGNPGGVNFQTTPTNYVKTNDGTTVADTSCKGGDCSPMTVEEQADINDPKNNKIKPANIWEGMENFMDQLKNWKMNRLQERASNLSQSWRQGISRTSDGVAVGTLIENPLNNWRQKMTSKKLAKLRLRHPSNKASRGYASF